MDKRKNGMSTEKNTLLNEVRLTEYLYWYKKIGCSSLNSFKRAMLIGRKLKNYSESELKEYLKGFNK